MRMSLLRPDRALRLRNTPPDAQHMHTLIGFMRAEDDWDQFKTRFHRALPKRGDTLSLSF